MEILEIKVMGESGIPYTVRARHTGIECTCPDHRYRGRECKHIRFLREQVVPRASAGTSLVSV
jgi:uncharacterized Zn finger protein